jgi:hypothetical protein
MVCLRMGLLEDAIREHLELKRLRGADPSEVAREQQEALDAPGGEAPATEDHAPVGEHETGAAGQVLEGADGHSANPPEAAPEDPAPSEFSHPGQETAELDMKAVLADENSTAGEHGALADPDLAEQRDSEGSGEEESLEWEVPARSRHDQRDSDSGAHEGQGSDAAGELRGEDPHPPDSAEEGGDRHAGAEQNASGQGRLSL